MVINVNPLEAMITKEKKQEIIKKFQENYSKAKSFVILGLNNLKVETERILRETLKEKGCLFQVTKKTLIYKAVPDFPFYDDELKQSFAILWDFNDGLSVFKTLLIEDKLGIKLKIIGGYFEKQKLTENEVWQIAKLPSKEELVAKVLYSLKILPQRLSFDLAYPIKKLVFALSTIKK